MPASPVVQATQESIESLRAAAAHWGHVFSEGGPAQGPLETEAESVARVFQAFSLAYGALPRFRTEAALRRFMESLQELARSLRAIRSPALAVVLNEAASAAEGGARQAESAFTALTGKQAEVPEAPRPVHGTVHRLLADRGYGFLRQEGSASDVFFTAQAVRGGRFASLRVGQSVSFRIVPDPRVHGRMQAVEVQPSI